MSYQNSVGTKLHKYVFSWDLIYLPVLVYKRPSNCDWLIQVIQVFEFWFLEKFTVNISTIASLDYTN